jgi:thiol-disulfide isomerase/thioredoxin
MRLFFVAAALAVLVLPGAAAEAPRQAPELVIHLANGQQLLLSQFRGKVVALELAHTTCVHCQKTSVLMEKLYREYGPKGFQPLTVAFNDYALMLVPDYVRELRLSFPVGATSRDAALTFLRFPLTKPFQVPQLVFIDRKGVIRAQNEGEEDEARLRAQIESLLGTPAAPRRGGKQRPDTR